MAEYIISSGDSSDGIILENDSLIICSGGIVTRTAVNEDGMVQVYGTADYTEVNESGTVFIHSGGTAYNTVLNSGGRMYISSTGIASATAVNAEGSFFVSRGGTANNVIVNAGGSLDVYGGGEVNNATVNAEGELYVYTSGKANNTIINSDGRLDVHGIMNDTTVNSGGEVWISSDGIANNVTVNSFSILIVRNGGTANLAVVNSNARVELRYGGVANNTTVKADGILFVSSGGIANNTVMTSGSMDIRKDGVANITTVNADGSFYIYRGGAANNTVVNSDGQFEVLGAANGITANSGGFVCISSGGRFAGTMTFESGATVSACKGATMDFDLTQTSAGAEVLVNDLSIIRGTPLYTLTVADSTEAGVYSLADGADEFKDTISVVNTSGDILGTLMVGDTIRIGDEDFTLNLSGSSLTLEVKTPSPTPEDLVGTKDRVSWKTAETERCVVEYSVDNFLHGIQVTTTTNALDMLALPAGTYQWRVRIEDSDQWTEGNEIISDNIPGVPKVLRSNSDGDGDIFFATTDETWEVGYYAQHVGSIDDWSGTNEFVSAVGRNRIKNFFFGSDDANILCLTDDANGDAIFVDDEFTELPEDIETLQSRIARINEIRCGVGDDIVDMTSQRFEYTGDGLTIRGGDGNDTIWANNGENFLFCDAGNDRIVGASGADVIVGGIGKDRMHGGGGNDIFTFCDNWGKDEVKQLDDGSVTLWFASGDLKNWDAETLTYTDDENIVQVFGIAAEKITLKFGENAEDAALFSTLSDMGAFEAFTTQRIYEESDKGILTNP